MSDNLENYIPLTIFPFTPASFFLHNKDKLNG